MKLFIVIIFIVTAGNNDNNDSDTTFLLGGFLVLLFLFVVTIEDYFDGFDGSFCLQDLQLHSVSFFFTHEVEMLNRGPKKDLEALGPL